MRVAAINFAALLIVALLICSVSGSDSFQDLAAAEKKIWSAWCRPDRNVTAIEALLANWSIDDSFTTVLRLWTVTYAGMLRGTAFNSSIDDLFIKAALKLRQRRSYLPATVPVYSNVESYESSKDDTSYLVWSSHECSADSALREVRYMLVASNYRSLFYWWLVETVAARVPPKTGGWSIGYSIPDIYCKPGKLPPNVIGLPAAANFSFPLLQLERILPMMIADNWTIDAMTLATSIKDHIMWRLHSTVLFMPDTLFRHYLKLRNEDPNHLVTIEWCQQQAALLRDAEALIVKWKDVLSATCP
jgi:hypothetical protein